MYLMKTRVLFFALMISGLCTAQQTARETYQRIANSAKNYVVDTTAVPEDKFTREIRNLRKAKGGFNINEAILFKIGEENMPASEKEKLEQFFTLGEGKKHLDNAVIWIYRKYFTLDEVKKLTRFYKSTTGKKMAANFPVIMLQSLKAAESIAEKYKQQK